MNDNPLTGEFFSLGPEPRQYTCHGDSTCALDIVIEGKELITILLKKDQRIVVSEVFPLDQRTRENFCDSLNKLIDQFKVLITSNPRLTPAEIEFVVQQFFVIGADIQTDRQRLPGMDTGSRRVQRKLADADRHATGALVTDPENGLAVGDNDQPDIVEKGTSTKNVLHQALVFRRDPESPTTPVLMTESLGRPAHRRCIDNGHQFLQVLAQHRKEQLFVSILKRHQAGILFHGIGKPTNCRTCPLYLLFQCIGFMGQQAMQVKI